MQPQLTTGNGNIIPLTNKVYETILEMVKNRSDFIKPTTSMEELEGEFRALLAESAITDELLAEPAHELKNEQQKWSDLTDALRS